MERREPSETAEPQNAMFRWVRLGHPRAITSVAVSESAQQKDYICSSIFVKQRTHSGEKTYEVELFEGFGRVGEADDRVISEICTIRQDQLPQPREGVDTPMLEAAVCDRGAARQIHLL